MKTHPLNILAGVLVISSLGIGTHLVSVYRQTSAPLQATSTAMVQTAPPPQDPGRAFATVSQTGKVASLGGTWSMMIDTNAWATCMVDLYRPDQQLHPLGKEASKATFLSPGKFIWTWTVPTGVPSGTWVARLICGTFENLATADQTIEVK